MGNQHIAKGLNELLANYQVYYQNLRGFHWNIQGKYFFELHVKFEELYNDSAIKIDEVAERILTIGHVPLHTFKDYLDMASLQPARDINDGVKAVETIIANLSTIVDQQKVLRTIAEDGKDSATGDLLAAFVEEQEKTLWMYKAWMK
jgi:starvation-inducible DNA-binding protein